MFEMHKHIDRIEEMVDLVEFSYRYAYDNGPSVGIRGVVDGNVRNDTIIVDGIPYLIAGDVVDVTTNKKLLSVYDIKNADVNSMKITVIAQGYANGHIIQIYLNDRKVVSRRDFNDDVGILSASRQ